VQDIGLMDDVMPVKPLAIGKNPASINTWISSKGVIALLHYDNYYNCFVQLRGRKKFTLFAPSDYRNLYVYPLHHPVSCPFPISREVTTEKSNFSRDTARAKLT